MVTTYLVRPCSLVETWQMSVVPSDLSDITYDPETETFFVVANGRDYHSSTSQLTLSRFGH